MVSFLFCLFFMEFARSTELQKGWIYCGETKTDTLAENDVHVYQFNKDSTDVRFSSCGSDFDTVFKFYDVNSTSYKGKCDGGAIANNFACISCNTDHETVTFNLTASNMYNLHVDYFLNADAQYKIEMICTTTTATPTTAPTSVQCTVFWKDDMDSLNPW
eukprot:178321_1